MYCDADVVLDEQADAGVEQVQESAEDERPLLQLAPEVTTQGKEHKHGSRRNVSVDKLRDA